MNHFLGVMFPCSVELMDTSLATTKKKHRTHKTTLCRGKMMTLVDIKLRYDYHGTTAICFVKVDNNISVINVSTLELGIVMRVLEG